MIYMNDLNGLMKDLIAERKNELFHSRAELDPRYTSEEHGIPMDDYVTDWDPELSAYSERLESAAVEVMKKCK